MRIVRWFGKEIFSKKISANQFAGSRLCGCQYTPKIRSHLPQQKTTVNAKSRNRRLPEQYEKPVSAWLLAVATGRSGQPNPEAGLVRLVVGFKDRKESANHRLAEKTSPLRRLKKTESGSAQIS